MRMLTIHRLLFVNSPSTFRALAPLLVMSCSQLVLAAAVGADKTLQRTVDPVILAGEKLPGLVGVDIDSIRLFSFQDGKALPVPFQFHHSKFTYLLADSPELSCTLAETCG